MNILPLIFALLASGFIPPANSGTIPDPDVMSCFSASANAALYKQDSAFSRKTDALEMAWSKAAQRDRFREKSVNPPPYVFPIVFHIVHQNGAENIADVDVQRSVDFLNQALANTDYYDPTTGANTQIQVCLAQRTPDNLSTNGINRIVSPLTNLHTDDDLTMKNLIRWAPRDYVNVWVVRELSGLGVGGGLAGYAYYPSAHGGVRDGIVMEARWLSRGEASVGVLIHELGHYLGLRHTFDGGCNNDDCTRDGDRVCDTPPDQSTVAVPCSGNANSCDTDTDSGFATDQNDMHINYMDYGYFRCYSAFTPGQRDRMHFFLDGIRRSLLESKGCLTPCPGVVDASFTGGDVTVPVGTTINFVNTSTNGNTYRWLENNSLLGTTPDYNQTFNTPGTYRIKLIAYPADQTLCQVDSVEQIIEVVCPVVADFTFPPATYETGAVVTFTNTSTGGGSSSWSVNGVQVMTDPNFTFTFAAPGRYQVCLQESNSLCTEDRCRSLIVRAPPCDVTARFSYNSVGFAVGGTLFFSNNSTGGSISTWTVDGTPTGNENNLTQTFPDLGSFEVCLRESNGVCEREFCRVVVVPEEPCTGSGCPGTQGCTEGFAYFYGKPDENQTEEVTAVLPYGDRYYLSVSSGNQLWVVAIREDGSIIWQTEIFPDGGGGLITEMLIDDEGQLAAIGRTSLDSESGTYSFMVRVNTDDGNLLWARSYQSDFTLPKFNRVFNQRGTGNYTIIGYTENTNSTTNVFDRDGLFLTVNKADGSIPTNPLHFQNNGSLRFNSAAYDADIGHYYVLGNFDNGSNPGTLGSGTFLLVLDEVGTPIANRSYNISQVESTSPVGIVKEGDELVVAITAELSSPQSHNTYLLRTSLDGGVKITTRIPDLTGPPREMIANSQGYILLGDVLFSPITTPPFQTELIQLDRNGTVSWANTILNHFHASSKQFPATPQMINTHNNQILLAGIHLSFWEGAVLKLDATGEPVSACNEAVPGAVVSEETALRSNVLQFFAEPNEYNTTDFFSEPGNLAFNEESCLPNCPEPNADSCLAPYTLIYTEVDAVDMGGFTAVVSGNDVHYVGGRLNEKPYLGAMHPDGTIIWSREFRLLNNGGVITDLILDDEGMLAGTGKMVTANSQFAGFAFRINPADGTILWARHYNLQLGDSGLYLNNIFARGGEYVLTGGHTTANSGINRPALLSVNQADGAQPSPGILYAPSAIQGFEDAEINPVTGTIYAMGTAGTFGGRRRRIRVFAIDQNNQLDWVTDYQNAQNDFIGRDLLWGNNQITVVGTLTEAGGTGSHLVYFQTDTIGGLTFSQSVDASFSIIPQALAWRETDLLLMAYNEANTHSLITTLDQAGTFPNSQLFEDRATVDPSFEAFEYNGRDLVSVGINSPTGGPVLEVLTAEGRQAAACRADGTTLIQLSPREINLSANALQDIPPPTELMPFIGTTEASEARLFLAPSLSCPTDCNEPDPPLEEICNNQIDDDEDGLIDCDDPDVADDCCCADIPTIDLGPDTTLCPGDFLVEGTNLPFVSYRWSTGATTDSISISASGEYWLEVIDSCGNIASDTLTLHLRPRPLLDLGPDTTLCSNAIIPLLAQDGFASYEWVDGTSEKSFTGYGEGDFWVIATDSCGGVQTDTVYVRFDPATEIDLGVDTLICPGDTLTFQLSGYTSYQWSESTFIDCTNCPEVRFAPTSDTLLLVAAELGGGCFSSDSIRISVVPLVGTRDSVYLCPGDSISFGGNTLFTNGQLYDLVEGSACEQIDTLDVFQLRDTLTRETFTICMGDSLRIFNRFEQVAGNYERSFSAANGCDSIHAIELVVFTPLITTATNSICAGDSTLIFGVFENSPGDYFRVFTGANGCDSTHIVTLEVNELDLSVEQLRPECGGAAGAGEVFFNQPGNAVSILWPDGTDQARNNNLAAGTYAVTVTTIAEGCTAIANLTIGSGRGLNLSATVTPETCPGENDGIINVFGTDLNGLSFSLNGVPMQSSPPFTDLPPNEYVLLVSDSLGCDEEFRLSVAAAGEALLDLPETITINLGDSVTLQPQTNLPLGNFLLNWSSSVGDTCAGCPTLTLRPTVGTTVQATLIDLNGCTTTDQVEIIVSEAELFYVPTAFSPNGDGVNDYFRLFPGPGVERILKFSIYDRWGGRVFLTEDVLPTEALAAWDGRSPNGQLPSIGVYVYLVDVRLITGEVISKAGEVLLMR